MQIRVEQTGLEVRDLRTDTRFATRKLHSLDLGVQLAALQRLSRALLESPHTILQELVDAAVKLCGADSAGLSVETQNGTDTEFYRWVATAGVYSEFLNALLPRYPSACGICLERGYPQHFTVGQKFFEILGVEAPLVTDGILLPWKTNESQGTIFVMAHGRTEAFDQGDVSLMSTLADFAALGIRQQRQHTLALAQERAITAAQMANELAHQINNPLQSMMNTAYLVAAGNGGSDSQALGRLLVHDTDRLSLLVKQLLSIPITPEEPSGA